MIDGSWMFHLLSLQKEGPQSQNSLFPHTNCSLFPSSPSARIQLFSFASDKTKLKRSKAGGQRIMSE